MKAKNGLKNQEAKTQACCYYHHPTVPLKLQVIQITPENATEMYNFIFISYAIIHRLPTRFWASPQLGQQPLPPAVAGSFTCASCVFHDRSLPVIPGPLLVCVKSGHAHLLQRFMEVNGVTQFAE